MVYIIFRPLTQDQTSVVSLCMEFIKRTGEKNIQVPVAWNIPHQFLQNEEETLLTYLSRRGVESGDILMFPGKTGKSHHALTVNQVKRELYQFSGDFRLPVWNGYFPYTLDLNRPELLEYYSKKTSILIEGIDRVYWSSPKGVEPFPLLLAGAGEIKQYQKIIKKNQAKPVFLLLEPSSIEDIPVCVDLIENLGPPVFKQLPNMLDGGAESLLSLEDIRGSNLPHHQAIDSGDIDPFDWEIIANMPGSVILEEGDVSVQFNKGTLHGIVKGKRELLPGMDSRIYLDYDGMYSSFSRDSSFSFSGSHARGLRARTSMPSHNGSPPWTAIHDYYFNEDSDDFHISIWWKAEKIPGAVKRISILEIPVAVIERDCGFTFRDLHGETHSIVFRLPRPGGAGKVHVFSGDQFSFGIPSSPPITFIFSQPTDRAVVEILPMKKRKNKFLINFAPGGIFLPRNHHHCTPVQERIDFRLNTKELHAPKRL